jgi:hypothetical protein
VLSTIVDGSIIAELPSLVNTFFAFCIEIDEEFSKGKVQALQKREKLYQDVEPLSQRN